MRIAQIAPLYEHVPPNAYGGTERVLAALCDELTRRGHDVTLFAADGSRATATLVPVVPAPLRTRMSRRELHEDAPELHRRMLSAVYARSDEFDLIHSHVDVLTFPFAERCAVPTVVTMHGRLDIAEARDGLSRHPGVSLVSISAAQREAVADLDLDWVGNVPNGLRLDAYLGARPPIGEHLAFVGRISPEKGPAAAVAIARRVGRELRIGAKIDPADVDYFRDQIQALFEADGVTFLGELDEARKPDFYGTALATLFPSDWPEPFGLVMLESLASGTPVIALRRGAVPEVITDGVTGFVCDTVDEMAAALGRVHLIDRDACRRAAARFSAATMADGYEQVYDQVLARRRGALAGTSA